MTIKNFKTKKILLFSLLKNKAVNNVLTLANQARITTNLIILGRNKNWGYFAPFCKIMIIRGIGYRFFVLNNDYIQTNNKLVSKININYWIQTRFIPSNSWSYCLNDEQALPNDWSYLFWELSNSRYLIIRAGHTKDNFTPLFSSVYAKTLKKDRKLIIFGKNKSEINNLGRQIFDYRKPSVYTGRGIRRKRLKYIRKPGKQEKNN